MTKRIADQFDDIAKRLNEIEGKPATQTPSPSIYDHGKKALLQGPASPTSRAQCEGCGTITDCMLFVTDPKKPPLVLCGRCVDQRAMNHLKKGLLDRLAPPAPPAPPAQAAAGRKRRESKIDDEPIF